MRVKARINGLKIRDILCLQILLEATEDLHILKSSHKYQREGLKPSVSPLHT